MKQRSIRFNYFLNISRIGFGILVGLLTMPYVNRTIGVEGLGKIEYVNSIIAYFVMFSVLGIPMYGVREIANRKDNIEERSKFVIELLSILFVTTLISYFVLFCFVINIGSLGHLKTLMIIMSSMIFFSNLGVEWFYQGMEDQKFITIRYFVVRILTLVLLFVFVKGPEDYLKYGFILVLSTVGGNVFNIINLKNHISFKNISFNKLDFKSHFKPVLTIFIASISVSIYVQLDVLMLGSLKGSSEVGYYAMANKLIRFVILLITTLGAVLLPRLSHLVNVDKAKYQIYVKKALNYFLIIAFPFTVLFLLLANDFTLLMGGKEFLPSVITMQVLAPIILIVSIAYFIGFLILYPQGKEYIYTIAVIISAVVSVIANYFLIPRYGHIGAAIVAVMSEFFGILIMVVLYYKELKKYNLINLSLLYYLLGSILMVAVILLISSFKMSLFLNLIVASISGFSIFYLVLFFFKEEIVTTIVDEIKAKLK